MEFKTTTGGDTTLVLDAAEEDWLHEAADALKQPYAEAFAQFETLRRGNPLASFGELAGMFLPAAGLANTPQAPKDAFSDLKALDQTISRALRNASSIQVEALLLGAKATTLQAIALTALLQAQVFVSTTPTSPAKTRTKANNA